MARRRISNLTVWVLGLVLVGLVLPPRTAAASWSLPALIVTWLWLDLGAYLVHRAQHAVPWAWRLHALHHSDRHIDVTTALRLHPLEALAVGAFFWIATQGVPSSVVVAHASTLWALAALTHSNVVWPSWLERIARPVLVTPAVHRSHHSLDQSNTNFGAVLSIWDRAFGTYAKPLEGAAFGIAGHEPAATVTAMLLSPFWSKL